MKPINLHRYTLLFFGYLIFIWALFTPDTKAAKTSKITTLPTTSKYNFDWHPYPCSIQIRSGLVVHESLDNLTGYQEGKKSNKQSPLVVIPTTFELDVLYINSFVAKQLESYPRIGLIFCLPYSLKKVWKAFRFPSVWGILTYVELYQSYPTMNTWGNKISIGIISGSALAKTKDKPKCSWVATKEITYHWQYARSYQLNFGFGLLLAIWSSKKMKDKPATEKKTKTIDDKIEIETPHNESNDSIQLKFAPITTIGIRYIANPDPFLSKGYNIISYRKRKGSRVDCSIVGSGRYLSLTKKYHPIFRGSSLFSYSINPKNALLFSLELGYSLYKKALLVDTVVPGGMEFTTLLGYEIRYGRYLLQLQAGCGFIDTTKPENETMNSSRQGKKSEFKRQITEIIKFLKIDGFFSVNAQYMFSERFFMGITLRPKEIPGIRLGVSL